MHCWGVVLRKFQSTALVSVSTAISFALLRGREKTGLVWTIFHTWKRTTKGTALKFVDLGQFSLPRLCNKPSPHHSGSRIPTIYLPSYAIHVACICLHFLQICHRLLLEEDESTAFQGELFIRNASIFVISPDKEIYCRWKSLVKWILFNLRADFTPNSLCNRFYRIKRSQFNPYGMPSI